MGKSIVEAQAERILRATELLRERAFVDAGTSVLVYSDEAGVPGHTVTPDGRCTCKDSTVGWAARNGIACKHREMVRMYREQRDAAPVLVAR